MNDAYTRARRVCLMGGVVQLLVFICCLLLGSWFTEADAVTQVALLALGGVPVWLTLLIVVHQHRLEALELIESEQLASAESSGTIFEGAKADDLLIARRRLRMMYRYLLPAVSLLLVGYLSWFGIIGIQHIAALMSDAQLWRAPQHQPLSLAFLVGAALVSFLFGRYAVGMARVKEWQLLRGAGSYLNGCAVLMFLAAIGLAFNHFFASVAPLRILALVVPIVMLVLALEFLLNFILDLYRPRDRDWQIRPAFDSRALALIATPESVARTISEAVNYQFGFEVTKTWFYQLLSRALVPLIFFGVATLFLLSCIVVVAPGDKVIIERFGSPLERGNEGVLANGIYFKMPWPIDRVYREQADEIKQIVVGFEGADQPPNPMMPQQDPDRSVILWQNMALPGAHGPGTEVNYIVGAEAAEVRKQDTAGSASVPVALLRVSMPVQYRIGNLRDYLYKNQDPDALLRMVASEALTNAAAAASLDDVLVLRRGQITNSIREQIQQRVEELELGIEVTYVGLAGVHPPPDVVDDFNDVVEAESKKTLAIQTAQREANQMLVEAAGDAAFANRMKEAVDSARREGDEAESKVFELLEQVGGEAATIIAKARADRWETEAHALALARTWKTKLATYKQAPIVYTTRLYLEALAEALADVEKYIIAADPDRVRIVVEPEDVPIPDLIPNK